MDDFYFNYQKQQIALRKFVNSIASPIEEIVIEDIKLRIEKDTFSPLVSEISIDFFNNIVKSIPVGASMLELGCGVGFFSIFLSKRGCKCLGVDISAKSIAVAKVNQQLNGLTDEKLSFIESDLFENVNSGLKFDYIISTLPFTCKQNCREFTNNVNNNIFFLPDATLISLIQGFKKYLGESGKLFFSFGSSGNMMLLEDLINDIGGRYTVVFKSTKEDIGEDFFVLELSV